MRRRSGAALVAVVALVALVAGCSSQTPPPEPSVAPTSASPSPTPEVSSPTGPSCPDGAYRVAGLEGRGSASAIGKGSGGDIAAAFVDGTFTFSSDGAEPLKVDLGPADAQVRFVGSITGTYEGEAAALRLRTTGAQGEFSIKGFGFTRTRSASSLADQVIGQDTTAQVVCDDAAGTAQVTLPLATLNLARA